MPSSTLKNFSEDISAYRGETKTWYCYDEFNVMEDLGTTSPFLLKNSISKHLTQYFEEHPIDNNDKVLKLVGSSSFCESVMSFLKGFIHVKRLDEKIDANTNLIAFNNGFLFDVESNSYRKIEKTD